ncbi:MAG: methyltransferase domain-containing protein [Pyrinomonadaceae bacterium]
MRIYETGRLLAEPFLPPLYKQVRSRLRDLIADVEPNPSVLDVGGRKSPYTIGLDARITVIDLPRQSEIQQKLNLGINEAVLQQLSRRRSNIDSVVLGDMTCSTLPDGKFDIAVAVEVLEHVEKDARFVTEVSRVLKPGGVFLMTTPNGDWVENKNPDHRRHYLRQQLSELLGNIFDEVTVEYAIEGSSYRKMGLKPWSVQHPLQTAGSILGNLVNLYQSSGDEIKSRAMNTHHLIAIARKSAKKNGYRGIF